MRLTEMIDEINRLLIGAFPTAQAHVNDCPEGFSRPAVLIRCSKLTRGDVNRFTVAVSAIIAVDFIPEVDDRGVASGDVLNEALETMQNIFRAGYIRIGNRAPKVLAAGKIENAIAHMDLTINYFDDRLPAQPEAPLMQSVETTTKINKEG